MQLIRFARVMMPDDIWYENVKEFLTWGPLDDNGKPIKKRKGEYFHRWIKLMENLGYRHEYRILDAADFGARTSRVRLFGKFTLRDEPIKWPRPTHAKDPAPASLLNPEPLQRWKPVRPVLDLHDWGESIFTREARGLKPLVPKTISRIEYGLNKYFPSPDGVPYILRPADPDTIANCDPEDWQQVTAQFFVKYFSGVNNVASVDAPMPTITTNDRLGLCTCQFMVKQWTGDANSQSLDEPHHTITTVPAGQLVTQFILPYNYGNNPESVNEPMGTILSKRDKYLVVGQFIEKQYRDIANVQSLDEPAGTITTVPKLRLISGLFVDSRIIDIRMRMLYPHELLQAQGFPPDYRLPASATKAKKFIGNSVVPSMVELLTHAQFGTEEQRISGVREYAMAS